MRLISDDLFGIVTVFQEAEGESFEGKIAVAEVILRRTKQRFRSDGSVTSTVLRDRQFSGWNHNSTNRTRSCKIDDANRTVIECRDAWEQAKRGTNRAPGALFYFNPRIVVPTWAKEMRRVARIGNHDFYAPLVRARRKSKPKVTKRKTGKKVK